MLLIMILDVINDYNISNFVIMVKNKVVHLIIMLDLMLKRFIIIMIWVIFFLNINIKSKNIYLKKM
jgi:hypothetical protein